MDKLIDRFIPDPDFVETRDVEVEAVPSEVLAAIKGTDLRDPVINTLFAVRDLPNRVARRLGGGDPKVENVAFTNVPDVGPGWIELGQEEGRELVLGAVGKFWRRDYGGRDVAADEFVDFDEPGYLKLAVSSRAEERGYDQSILHYEARVEATDEEARRQFVRYWKVIAPGNDIIVRRALQRIKAEAEWRECLTGALADR
ncbi:MAG: hypothetical protein R3314_06425 [Longimicrobiales bacterium]|nr:hypothetical protein [Longimicrobiales bacterium]